MQGTGLRTEILREVPGLVAKMQMFPGPSQLWFLRTTACLNLSVAQQLADAFDTACPTPSTTTQGQIHQMFINWLMGAELSGTDKAAVVAAWEAMDTNGFRWAQSAEGVPLSVKLLLRERGVMPGIAEREAIELSGQITTHADVPGASDHPVEYASRCGICIAAKRQGVR